MTLDQIALEVGTEVFGIAGSEWDEQFKEFAQRLIARLEGEPPVAWKIDAPDAFWYQDAPDASENDEITSIPLYVHPPMNRAVIENVVEDLMSYSATGYWNTDHIDNAIAALKALLGDEKMKQETQQNTGCCGYFANCEQPCTAKGEWQERQRIKQEPGFYDGYKCGQKDAHVRSREYEELRSIIDNGSESMTHEDAVKELKRVVLDAAMFEMQEIRTAGLQSWQPIDTYPKAKGTHYLLFGGGEIFRECAFVGYWDGRYWRDMPKFEIASPTHWMPLPLSPKIGGK